MLVRQLSDGFIDRLKATNLWRNHLRKDCQRGVVFLAIRNDYVDFYYKGGRLFHYNGNNFSTHIKYASVIDTKNDNRNYLTEQELTERTLVSDFEKGYERIKENCFNFSKVEALGVAKAYEKNSYTSSKDIIFLDLEIAFQESGKNQDRIDFLIFNTKEKEIQFIEAKHYTNSEIRAKGTPKVIRQVKKYNDLIRGHRNAILLAYVNYIALINQIFDLELPSPSILRKDTKLFIFGFDEDQSKGRLTTQVLSNSEYKEVVVYTAQQIDDSLTGMWKKKISVIKEN